MIEMLIAFKLIAAFNHTHERQDVLTRDARIPDFARCWQPERSQMYFEVTGIRVISKDAAEVYANGNRFGMYRETAPAVFQLKKEGADWKIDSLRVYDSCLDSKR